MVLNLNGSKRQYWNKINKLLKNIRTEKVWVSYLYIPRPTLEYILNNSIKIKKKKTFIITLHKTELYLKVRRLK